MRRAVFVLASTAFLAGCDDSVLPDINLERMIDQAREKVYKQSDLFPDGRAMRSPPEDSVAVSRRETAPDLATGEVSGDYLTRPRLPVTRASLALGRTMFETYCSACHGIRGDGESIVAANMSLRRPPSLIGARVQGFPDGRIYQAIVLGYGLMRPYTEDLTSPEERWATVSYVRALQLSQSVGVPFDSLSPQEQRRAAEELR